MYLLGSFTVVASHGTVGQHRIHKLIPVAGTYVAPYILIQA